MTVGFVRKINGIKYELDEEFKTKREASEFRKIQSAQGNRAVIIPNPPSYKGDKTTYAVFVGGKKKSNK